jgi:hypothetical protein
MFLDLMEIPKLEEQGSLAMCSNERKLSPCLLSFCTPVVDYKRGSVCACVRRKIYNISRAHTLGFYILLIHRA